MLDLIVEPNQINTTPLKFSLCENDIFNPNYPHYNFNTRLNRAKFKDLIKTGHKNCERSISIINSLEEINLLVTMINYIQDSNLDRNEEVEAVEIYFRHRIFILDLCSILIPKDPKEFNPLFELFRASKRVNSALIVNTSEKITLPNRFIPTLVLIKHSCSQVMTKKSYNQSLKEF